MRLSAKALVCQGLKLAAVIRHPANEKHGAGFADPRRGYMEIGAVAFAASAPARVIGCRINSIAPRRHVAASSTGSTCRRSSRASRSNRLPQTALVRPNLTRRNRRATRSRWRNARSADGVPSGPRRAIRNGWEWASAQSGLSAAGRRRGQTRARLADFCPCHVRL